MRKQGIWSVVLLMAVASVVASVDVAWAQDTVPGLPKINAPQEAERIVKMAESGDVDGALERYDLLRARQRDPEFLVVQVEVERKLSQLQTSLAADGEKNTPRGMYNLGRLFSQGGFGAKPRMADAAYWYRKAAQAGDARAMSTLGFILVFRQNNLVRRQEGYALIKKAALMNDPIAMLNMGVILQDGLEITGINLQKAMEWYTKAAEAGSTQAMNNMAALYDQGVFRGPEPEKATEWYKKAADAGNTEAMVALANRMRLGVGAQANPKETLALYQKAIADHSARGVFCLGMSYAYGWVTPIDYPRAVQLLESAGQMGYTPALVELGHMYTKGIGVAVSQNKAFECFKQAASAGDAQGMFYLGLSYNNGWGTPPNPLSGLDLIKRAADAGEIPAMVTLAKMYYDGRGTDVNQTQAMTWMRKAATLGNLEAKQILQTWSERQ